MNTDPAIEKAALIEERKTVTAALHATARGTPEREEARKRLAIIDESIRSLTAIEGVPGREPGSIAVLVVQDEGEGPIRENTAPATHAGIESLQEQAARHRARGSRAWVQRENA